MPPLRGVIHAAGVIDDGVVTELEWPRFESEALADGRVQAALKKYVCVKVDYDGSDDDNRLWQQHKQPNVPSTLIFEPDGKLLATITALKTQYYAEGLEAAWPAYYDKIVPARQALAKDASKIEPLVLLAEAFALLNNKDDSAAYYAKAVAAYEAKGDAKGALDLVVAQVKSYYDLKWYAPARPACRKLLELDPADKTGQGAIAAWVLGMADCGDRKWDDAISVLKAACEKYKGCAILDKMLFSLGSAYMYAKQKDKAIATFEEIVAKFPDSETAGIAQTQLAKLKK